VRIGNLLHPARRTFLEIVSPAKLLQQRKLDVPTVALPRKCVDDVRTICKTF
jgi:hypothetical protein